MLNFTEAVVAVLRGKVTKRQSNKEAKFQSKKRMLKNIPVGIKHIVAKLKRKSTFAS